MNALLLLLEQLQLALRVEADGPDDAAQEISPEQARHMRLLIEALMREAQDVAEVLRQREAQADADMDDLRRREELLARALEAIARADWPHAELILRQALEEFPHHHEYLSHLGLIAWERGDMIEAERAYRLAADSALAAWDGDGGWSSRGGRDYLRAVEGRALCLYQLGELDEACALFETLGCTRATDYQGCHYLAGEIHHLQQRLDDAARCYEAAPVEPSVLYNLSLATFERGDLEAATTTLLRAFAANRYICEALLERPIHAEEPDYSQGYLGSAAYAQEFISACAELWHRHHSALVFMQRCFDDPVVRGQLLAVPAHDPTRATHDGPISWRGQHPSADDLSRFNHLARTLLQRMFV